MRMGDRVRAILHTQYVENRGPQLMLSRLLPEMLMETVPYQVRNRRRSYQLKARPVIRVPDAKIAVKTNDKRIDPVVACVEYARRACSGVTSELGGNERIDIVLWDDNPRHSW